MNILTTERLRLRQYQAGDKDDFIVVVTDQDVMKHVEHGAVNLETATSWWNQIINTELKGFRWRAELTSDGSFCGHAMLNEYARKESYELGYILKKSMWGQGYATEIATAVKQFANNSLGLEEIYATVDDDHHASIHVLEKTGFSFLEYDFDEAGRFSVFINRLIT
ncbi:MAG: GNAT family N-acetyltransferase [Pyrinomonadaceae bacterium]